MEKEYNYDCGYHNEEMVKKFIEENGLDSCKLPCPANSKKICYRWAICFIGRHILKEKEIK